MGSALADHTSSNQTLSAPLPTLVDQTLSLGQPPEMGEATSEQCAVCMEECELLELECGHKFCNECLRQQVSARWPGPRITFGYLHCALCRAPMAHSALEELLIEHVDLKQRVL